MRESQGRGRAGIASLCLALSFFLPLPSGAPQTGEVLQLATSTRLLFLEMEQMLPVLCGDAFLLPQPWQQICSRCQSEVVGAVWGSSLTAFCWALSLDVRGAICLPSPGPPSVVLDALVRLFAGQGAGSALLLQGFPCRPWSWHWCWTQKVLPPCPGCRGTASRAGLCSEFHVHEKELSFHLSSSMKKLLSCSGWLGLCHTLAAPCSLLPASQGCCGWGGGTLGRYSACQKGLGLGRGALGSQVKGSPPKKTLSPRCLPQRSVGWLQAAALPLAGASPSPKSPILLSKETTSSTEPFGKNQPG